ncbi:MAG: hypothetical protein FWB94_12285 [Chitinispirillia bacterium]|nr:hypothetical protein [Chitinispirillia bacterium]
MSHTLAEYSYFDDPDNQCVGEKWWECVLTVTAKIDIDCDGIPDSVVVKHVNGKLFADGVIRIFDQNGAYKDSLILTANTSRFLGVIQLPFDPANDSGYVCSKRILELFYSNGVYHEGRLYRDGMSLKPDGLWQIKYIIKNSVKKASGPWMDMADIDTSFQGYAGVMSQSDFSSLGIKLPEWTGLYCSDGTEDNSKFTRDSKGLLISYYAPNHLRTLGFDYPGMPKQESIVKIPVSKDVILYQTAHGVLLRKGDKIRWVYFSDMQERLRWPSVEKVTVSNGLINVFLKEEVAEYPKPAKPLRFSLKDLLK